MSSIIVLYHAVILVLLVMALGHLLINLKAFPTVHLKKWQPGRRARKVSVLVPARNEVLRVGPCARALQVQDYPDYEVLILDDNSTDGTSDLLRSLGYSEEPGAKYRLLHGTPLPAGWTGKGWACHQLAKAASGDLILFLDADTDHQPEMLSSAVHLLEERNLILLSAWPYPETKTWSEKLILPLIHLSLAVGPVALWTWLLDRPDLMQRVPPGMRRFFGAANGQFLLFDKEGYWRIGGHAGCRSHMVEDVALGRAAALLGERALNADGKAISSVRMYTRFSEVWEGFTKNIRAAFEDSLALYFLVGTGSFLATALPFFLIWFSHGVAFWLVLAQISIILLMRAILTFRFHTTWFGCFLHPVAQVIITLIGLNSWRRSAGRGVTWKGRLYEVVHPGSQEATTTRVETL